MTSTAKPHPLRPLHIDVAALCQIAATVGSRPAEFGGMLGAGEDDVVRHFVFDRAARRTGTEYNPDTRALSHLYREQWKPRGIRIVGFVHSHPPGTRQPSWADAEYAARLLDWRPELDRLLMPIVMAEPDTGRFELLPYVALRAGRRARVAAVSLRCLDDHLTPNAANVAPTTRPRGRMFAWTAAATAAGVAIAGALYLAESAPMAARPTSPLEWSEMRQPFPDDGPP